MNEFIDRTNHVLSEIISERDRPDRDVNRLRELRAELKVLAKERKPMKKDQVIREACLLTACLLLAGGMLYLWVELKQSRANEVEMSKRLYQAVKGAK